MTEHVSIIKNFIYRNDVLSFESYNFECLIAILQNIVTF